MNARFARVLSRVSLVSVIAVSALGAAACNSARSSDASAAAAAEAKAKAPESRAERGPGHRMFRQIEALDLRADQRVAVAEIEQQLAENLASHRETARQLAEFFAAGVETGELDPDDIASHQAALEASVVEARAAFSDAFNDVHDTLDANQRATLVAELRAHHERHRRGMDHEGADQKAAPEGSIVKLALELGITDEQRQALREAAQKGADDLFPSRKVHREAWEAKMKALGEAFISDDFDAADHDLACGAEEALKSFGEVATRAVQVTGKVLTSSQRGAVAAMIRAHAAKI